MDEAAEKKRTFDNMVAAADGITAATFAGIIIN